MELTIHLIRHGESTGNVIGQLQSIVDTELTEKGYSQAEELHGKLDVDIVYHSPLTRAKETAKTIFKNEEDLIEIKELREFDLGVLAGELYSELNDDQLELFEKIKTDDDFKEHNGESHNEFRKRVLTVMDDIVKDMEKREIGEAAVVTHGGVLQDFLQRYLEEDVVLDNCVVHSVRFKNGKWGYIEQFH